MPSRSFPNNLVLRRIPFKKRDLRSFRVNYWSTGKVLGFRIKSKKENNQRRGRRRPVFHRHPEAWPHLRFSLQFWFLSVCAQKWTGMVCLITYLGRTTCALLLGSVLKSFGFGFSLVILMMALARKGARGNFLTKCRELAGFSVVAQLYLQ